MTNTQVPAITVDDMHVRFVRKRLFKKTAEAHVLKGISFTLNKGDSLAVIGFNGAGKSTLLRVMAEILAPDAGKCLNHNVSTALLAMGVGMFPQCSGRVNTVMQLMLQLGIGKREAESMVDGIAAYAELERVIDDPLTTYSTGMSMRLQFAIATQSRPDVLLVDEILAVGDLPFRQKSIATMRAKLSSGDTVVFVSHALNEVRELCQRAIWLENGIILADGAAKDVVKEYVQYFNILGKNK
ncbi:MAG: ATP-binding cassette domain-containing protein [Deltaproteobacteria bacterium]|jgi:ABC-type polysaccharide/polyol phosphate transport system ATPase subunit|nr:ATP-binding cassette domain-containing protein [Deltaproteobacteria bacterium]